ncbi:glycosyltransferase family 9 protein [Bacteroidota bacterium]
MGKRILIVRTDRVGDVVMITPIVREIKKTFPDSFVATLTQPYTSKILINNHYVDKILTDDLKKETFWKVVKKLRKFKFTDGLLVMSRERAAYQMFLAGVKNRIGVGHKLYEVITLMKSVSRNKYIPLRHEADYSMDLARKIGIKSNNLTPEIFPTENEILWGKEFLENINVQHDDFKIIIHTGSGDSSPNWSEEKYFELITNILREHNQKYLKILLTAREMSATFLEKIDQLNEERIVNISGKVDDLRNLIKVISNINLLVTSSTGPIHLASALGIRTIGLYCKRPMDCAKKWGALGINAINVEVSKEHCDNHCSEDKKKCDIENGIEMNEITELIKMEITKQQKI